MKTYIGDNFLLHSATAERLYHTYAAQQPIFDYHCHLNPAEILSDKHFHNLTELWLLGDHYKWRLMRAAGVEEAFITGDADDYAKFEKWADTVEKSIGNPLYPWTHLELKRYFGVDTLLSAATARAVWEQSVEAIGQSGIGARELICKSNVRALCTTDDPADSLKSHLALAKDASFPVRVVPTFRPEQALHPENGGFSKWIGRLGKAAGFEIDSYDKLEEALYLRAEAFKAAGCVGADQSLGLPDFGSADGADAGEAFRKALAGKTLTAAEQNAYCARLLLFLGRTYAKLGFVMQLHLSVIRNVNEGLFAQLGPDTGFDTIGDGVSAKQAAAFLSALGKNGGVPKTVLYSLNPGDFEKLAAVAGCFQGGCWPQRVQLGAPWWFNDHRDGMFHQMKALANTGLLAGFIGMLTDSRSFLSYTRHEYFRRVLCDLLGTLAEGGEAPADDALLGKMAEAICFHNAVQYFGIPV